MNSVVIKILMGCFGAQAILSGLFTALSVFNRTIFLIYGIAFLPFFIFNYYFLYAESVFNNWMFLYFGANLVMAGLCGLGWWLLSPKVED